MSGQRERPLSIGGAINSEMLNKQKTAGSLKDMLRKTSSTERTSMADNDSSGELKERTTSYAANLKKQKSKVLTDKKGCEDRLRETVLKLPSKIDAELLASTIQEGEELNVDAAFLDRCRNTLADAQKLAAKRREEERQQKLQFRVEQVSKKLQTLTKVAPLDADLAALKAALDETNALEEEASPHKVDTSLSMISREFLEEAERAHAERRKAAEATLQSAMRAPLLVDVDALRNACEAGKAAGVDRPLLNQANDLLGLGQRRLASAGKLGRICELSPEDVDIDGLRKAWGTAVASAVPHEALALGARKLREAEAAQRMKAVTSARLERLVEVSAAQLDQSEVRVARGAAEEAGASPTLLARTDEALAAAAKAQLLRDAATASLLVLAAPRAPERGDMNALRDLLPKAPVAGVSAEVVTLVQASLTEAEGAQAGYEDKRDAHIARVIAANKRTVEGSSERREAARTALEALEAAEQRAKDRTAADTSAYDSASAACATALAAIAHTDGSVATAPSVKAEAEAWTAAEGARAACVSVEEQVKATARAVEAAMQAEMEAQSKAAQARLKLDIATQLAEVIGQTAATTDVAQVDVSLLPRRAGPGGGGGCCGGGAAKNVHVPATQEDGGGDAFDATPLKPLPPLVDEMAWSPLKLPAGSKHQIELLLAFAFGGFYSSQPICAAVAAAVCTADPTLATASSFLLGLSDGFGSGKVSLTAGGAKMNRPRGAPETLAGRLSFAIGAMVSPRGERGIDGQPSFRASISGPPSSPGRRSLSKRSSEGGDRESTGELKRAQSSFRRTMTLGRSGSRDTSSDPAAAWPGRVVVCEVDEAAIRLMMEVWLAAMARGGQSNAPAPPHGATSAVVKAKGKGGESGGAAKVGRLSSTIAKLLEAPHAARLASINLGYRDIMQALLERHFEVTQGRADEGDEGDEAAIEAAHTLRDVHACIELLLGSAMRTTDAFDELLPVFATGEAAKTSPSAALAGMARAFAQRFREGAKLDEKVVLALLRLFVARPDSLTGFQQLVPTIFDEYLKLGTPLRAEMGRLLSDAGFDPGLVERINTDEQLVRQPFFWSAPGMRLFGRHDDIHDPAKLHQLLTDALSQQAIIAAAFLDEVIRAAAADTEQAALLPALVRTTLACLLEHVEKDGAGDIAKVRRGILLAIDTILFASATHADSLFAAVYPSALEAWSASAQSGPLLDHYVVVHFQPRLSKHVAGGSDGIGHASGIPEAGSTARDLAIVQTLCSLFIARPTTLTAFTRLVPQVFETLLALGSPARASVNAALMEGSFEPTLKTLIAESDDFVRSSFFWAADGAMALCTRERVAKAYSKMNAATHVGKNGVTLHLYPRLLQLLLRLSSHRGGEAAEIAFRTKEVLDQFERNPDQQAFLLTVIETLDERSRSDPCVTLAC